MASAQSSVEINTEINTTGSSEERDRQVNAAMLMSCFSDETPPSTVPVTTGVGGTMEERVAAYKERKERMKQQRKDKAARQAKEKEWFDLEMEKPYTEQQAIEEMLQHTIPQDWTSLRGSRDFQDQPPNHLYASNASEASSGSLSSTSSVSSNAQVVHEQVAWRVNARRSGSPSPEDPHATRGERRAWTAKGAETRPTPGNAGYAHGDPGKRKQVTRIRVEL